MSYESFIAEIESSIAKPCGWNDVLSCILHHFAADSGTIHLLGEDGALHLQAASAGLPQAVLDTVKSVPVGKGMAGLAVSRKQPVTACDIQTDASGDVRPGALATGLRGSIVVPLLRGERAVGALGIANRHERTFSDAETELLLSVGRALGAHHSASGP